MDAYKQSLLEKLQGRLKAEIANASGEQERKWGDKTFGVPATREAFEMFEVAETSEEAALVIEVYRDEILQINSERFTREQLKMIYPDTHQMLRSQEDYLTDMNDQYDNSSGTKWDL